MPPPFSEKEKMATIFGLHSLVASGGGVDPILQTFASSYPKWFTPFTSLPSALPGATRWPGVIKPPCWGRQWKLVLQVGAKLETWPGHEMEQCNTVEISACQSAFVGWGYALNWHVMPSDPSVPAIFEVAAVHVFFVTLYLIFNLEKRRSGGPRPFSPFLFRQVEAFWRLVPTVVTLRCAWPWQFPTVVWYLWRFGS